MGNKNINKECDYKRALRIYEERRDKRRKSIRYRTTKFIKRIFSHYDPEEVRREIIQLLTRVGFYIVMYYLLYVICK